MNLPTDILEQLDLLPCPRCGGEATFEFEDGIVCMPSVFDYPGWCNPVTVVCTGCGHGGVDYYEDAAQAALYWNDGVERE